MRILAIDPGSKLGWATDATGRLEWGTEDFRIRNGESSGNRWRRFSAWLDDVLGYNAQHKPHEFQKERCIDLLIYERAHFMPRARAAAEIAAGFTTRLEEHCERHGIALQPVAVQTLKAFALPKVRRKKGDPKMDRSKAAMIAAAMARWNRDHAEATGMWMQNGLLESPVGRFELTPLTEHEADALWLYWLAKFQDNRSKPFTLSP